MGMNRSCLTDLGPRPVVNRDPLFLEPYPIYTRRENALELARASRKPPPWVRELPLTV